jgi:hypothetical protein
MPKRQLTRLACLSILGGICLGLSVAFLIGALIWVEARNPTKAPAPEL